MCYDGRITNMVGAMFKSFLFAASAACLVMADTAKAETYLLVSCYRGPWTEVIWDRANPEFIRSLEAHGYTTADATRIADSMCRDPRLVYNPTAMAREVRAVTSGARRW